MRRQRIAVLTGGGDCAGLNPAIKWVVKTALDIYLQDERDVQYEVLGIREGWKGLIEYDTSTPGIDSPWVEELDEKRVRNWDRAGGTWLGTSRSNPFDTKNDRSERVMANIEALELDVIIAIGGEDTLGVAQKLFESGVNVVGIPKTIDKDMGGTDYSLGFQTALEVITREVDALRTTAGSHGRIFVVETMGRHAGWLALHGGISSGAYIILIPEWDFDVERVCKLLIERRNRGVRYSIVVVSEGAKATGMQEAIAQDIKLDSFGHKTLGGVGQWLRKQIVERTGLDTRSVTLSHLQRGGLPSAFDRMMGRNFGIAAVDMIDRELFGQMVSYSNGLITHVPLTEAIGKLHVVDVEKYYDTERYNGRRKGILTTISPGVVRSEES